MKNLDEATIGLIGAIATAIISSGLALQLFRWAKAQIGKLAAKLGITEQAGDLGFKIYEGVYQYALQKYQADATKRAVLERMGALVLLIQKNWNDDSALNSDLKIYVDEFEGLLKELA